jgi:hypothetical protein
MLNNAIAGRVVTGAAAGLAATAGIMHPLRETVAARLPSTKTPMNGDPGEFMVERIERILPETLGERIPDRLEHAAVKSLHLGYGMTFGALYGLARKKPGDLLADGAILGITTWAAGYLGWLPATGLTPPITKQRPRQVITPIVEHIIFGIAVVAMVRGVQSITQR